MLRVIPWHFCSQASSTKKLEKMQDGALRFIYNDKPSNYADLLKSAGTVNLHIKRTKDIACEVYKIVNKLAASFIHNLVALKYSKYSTRRDKAATIFATIPSAQTPTYGHKLFSHRLWNCFPNEFRVIDNYCHFRRLLQNWDGPGCHCSVYSNCSFCCNVVNVMH